MTANPRIVAFAWGMVGLIVAVGVAVVVTDSPAYDVPPSVVQRPTATPGTPVPPPSTHPSVEKLMVGAHRSAAHGKYVSWQMPPGPICFQHNGWTSLQIPAVARAWSASGVPVTAAARCDGYPTRRVVQFRTYVNNAQTECAKTGSATYTWTYAYGRWVWLADAMTVWINQARWVKTRCYATAAMVAHVVSHETGHALALAHNTDASVMGAWAYQLADRARRGPCEGEVRPMNFKSYVMATYMPDAEASPTGLVNAAKGWATLDLHEGPGRFVVQFGMDDRASAVRYLRELAAEATKIADQIEAALDEEYAR